MKVEMEEIDDSTICDSVVSINEFVRVYTSST